MASVHENENVRYEPDENPPSFVAIGAGLQAAIIIVAAGKASSDGLVGGEAGCEPKTCPE